MANGAVARMPTSPAAAEATTDKPDSAEPGIETTIGGAVAAGVIAIAQATEDYRQAGAVRDTTARLVARVVTLQLVLTVFLLSGSAAVAQQAGRPCAGDIKTLCAGIQPGEGRIKACIKSHLADLSPNCADQVLTVAVTGKVCKTDVTNLCAGIVPGTGGIRACIKSHMAEVSDSCRDAMSQAAAGKKLFRRGDL